MTIEEYDEIRRMSMNCKTIEDCLACPMQSDCLNNKAKYVIKLQKRSEELKKRIEFLEKKMAIEPRHKTKMLIEIPDNFNLENEINTMSNPVIRKALKNGTPLPEHYGRLIDADVLKSRAMYINGDNVAIEGVEVVTVGMIDNAETIIPATKEGEK